MVSQVQTPDYPLGLDGGTYEANAWRTLVVTGLTLMSGTAQVQSGVFGGGGGMNVTAPGGMNVRVATGYCVVASASGSTFGGYLTGQGSAATLSVATSDPTNPRIDLVIVSVTDNGSATSSGVVQIITGTPASSPSPPALPSGASSFALAQVAVAANASAITSGSITDVRAFTAASGGIVPMQSVSSGPGGHGGLYTHDLSTGRLWYNPAGGPTQPQVLPFAPVMAARTSDKPFSGSETTVLSVSFTSPGGVDVKLFASWPGFYLTSGGGSVISATMRLKIDGSQVATKYVRNASNDGTSGGGADLIHYTSSLTGDTPAAGTHTVTWTFMMTSATANITITGATYAPMLLRAEPVNL